ELFPIPTFDWNIDGWVTIMSIFHHCFPIIQDVSVSDESAMKVHEKARSGDEGYLKLLIVVQESANHWDDDPFSVRYCFDRHAFLPAGWVERNEEQCENNKI